MNEKELKSDLGRTVDRKSLANRIACYCVEVAVKNSTDGTWRASLAEIASACGITKTDMFRILGDVYRTLKQSTFITKPGNLIHLIPWVSYGDALCPENGKEPCGLGMRMSWDMKNGKVFETPYFAETVQEFIENCIVDDESGDPSFAKPWQTVNVNFITRQNSLPVSDCSITLIGKSDTEDETQFDVRNVYTDEGVSELAELFEAFCKENSINIGSVLISGITIVKKSECYEDLEESA